MSVETLERSEVGILRKRGRAFGTPNLSNERKADILVQKHLQLESQTKIAQNLGVSRISVVKTKPDNVSPEVLELVAQKSVELASELVRVRDKALVVIDEHLENRTMPAGSLATVFGVLYDKHRLQTDQSTSNVAVNQRDLTRERLLEIGWSAEKFEAWAESEAGRKVLGAG